MIVGGVRTPDDGHRGGPFEEWTSGWLGKAHVSSLTYGVAHGMFAHGIVGIGLGMAMQTS